MHAVSCKQVPYMTNVTGIALPRLLLCDDRISVALAMLCHAAFGGYHFPVVSD